MRLGVLWPETPLPWADIAVADMTADSRRVRQGSVFVALRGARHDGRQFISAAIAQGAVAVLSEDEPSREELGVPIIGIAALNARLGEIADRFFGSPSAAMSVLAVTGTNGKTSTAQMLARASAALGHPAGVLGTLGNGMVGRLTPSSHTTLDPIGLQGKLAAFRTAGADVVALEASSHGLEQGRLNGVRIRTAIFTNLTRDHLDYHGTMEAYRDAKARLFRWPGLQTAVLNADDPASDIYRRALAPSVRCWTYSLSADSGADFVALSVEPGLQGLHIRCRTPQGDGDIRSRLLGRFNVSNLLAVLAGLLSLDVPLPAAINAMAALEPVPGRMQCVAGEDVLAVVDYAHTPDALEKALQALREHVSGTLWCVFGCGGDRDRGKRPLMGGIAARLADRVIVTADNPRSEAVDAIINDILAGVGDSAGVRVEPDRAAAIRLAVSNAAAGDLILIAGKGHEDYQEIQGVRYPFDDVETVRAAMDNRKSGSKTGSK